MNQIFAKTYNSEENFANYLKIMVEHELRNLNRNLAYTKVSKLYGIGTELEQIYKILNKKDDRVPAPLTRNELSSLCIEMQNCSEEEIIHKYNVSYDLAETFYAVAVMFLKITDFFKCEEIIIPRVSLKDSLIMDMIDRPNDDAFYKKLQNQIKVNAINIGNSLNFDAKHASKVADFSMKIFDATKHIHRLGNLEKCYLLAAAILHDIGISISVRSHHKHSLYIIKAQNFFYFDEEQINIIANTARYHRKSAPKSTHPDYTSLSHKNKMIVMKLAAILRIADSLDNTHLSLIEAIEVNENKKKIYIDAKIKGNIFAEEYSFNGKKELFEDFFGYTLKLREIEL